MTTDTVPPTPPDIAAPHEIGALERLGDEIATLSAHLDAASARLLDLLREFDARGGWNTGFRSCAHWLAWRVGLDLGAARERVRVARALGRLPRLAQAEAQETARRHRARALYVHQEPGVGAGVVHQAGLSSPSAATALLAPPGSALVKFRHALTLRVA